MPGSPLAGLKVLELARILAGPWAGQVLADLGADVVKVERRGTGDDTRAWGPPFVESADGAPLDSAYYHSCNRGKRSIAVDFEQPAGQDIVRRLAERSDVLIENFKVGGLKRFGLDYDELAKLNPRLVYCSITGFGQDGPYAKRSGYDFMIQGMGGIMDLTGAPEGEPMKVGVAFADIFTGLYAVIGIQAALAARERTGRGQLVDMALLDAQVGVLANQASNYLVSGKAPHRLGNAHPNIVPYQVFPAADSHIIIATGNDRQFADVCRILGVPQLASDQRFVTNASRVRNRNDLMPLLFQQSQLATKSELLATLEAAHVPAGPINSLPEVFADPQVAARGLRLDLPAAGAKGGTVPSVRTPIRMSESALSYVGAAPRFAEHTREILGELGYLDEEIDRLRELGTIGLDAALAKVPRRAD
jgi:crotonobetainyl-CoA:carnitine CoA-transferase CaiB-like acyl-CoA transferase